MSRKMKDLTGLRFGHLIALRLDGKQNRKYMWLCQCDCGRTARVRADQLYLGITHSCGHLRGRFVPNSLVSASPKTVRERLMLHRYKQNSRNRGHAWLLTRKQALLLMYQPCWYCGCKPSENNSTMSMNGIDRVDNDGDYTVDNTVACCAVCNRVKFLVTLEEFVAWVHRAHRTLAQKDF